MRLVGPMVGHVTPDEANLWAYAGPGAMFSLEYWSEDEDVEASLVLFEADASANHAAKVRLTGLKPHTMYRYVLTATTPGERAVSGHFRTAPPRGGPGRFQLATASCMRFDNDQSAWRALGEKDPSFLVLLGDNVYSESTVREVIWSHHLKYRMTPEFADVIRDTPTYAIWDDHDYAGDNAGATARGKANSLRAFTEVWANPAAGTEDIPGIFFRFRWADVEFFMLDTRYHRSSNIHLDNSRKRMLGDAQYEWLREGLLSSDATFKVIASGSTLRAALTDSWRRYSFSRQRIFDTIMENEVSGVFFLTGDLHRCQIDVHDANVEGGYPIHEVISSGITRGMPVGFVTIQFDTIVDDPSFTVRIWKGDGSLREQRTIRLSELRVTAARSP